MTYCIFAGVVQLLTIKNKRCEKEKSKILEKALIKFYQEHVNQRIKFFDSITYGNKEMRLNTSLNFLLPEVLFSDYMQNKQKHGYELEN